MHFYWHSKQNKCRSCEHFRKKWDFYFCNNFPFPALLGTRQGENFVVTPLGKELIKNCWGEDHERKRAD